MTLKQIFFALFARPLIMLIGGVRLSGVENLPKSGPAIIVANHNSHLDALVLMTLFPIKSVERVRPVAADDYFFSTPLRSFVAKKLMGILPIERERIKRESGRHPLWRVLEALDNGEIVIIFPEGSRGEPGVMKPFKKGFAHIAKMRPEVPVTPVHIEGTDRALPKEEALWVPFIVELSVMKAQYFENGVREFTQKIERLFHEDC